MKIVRLLSELPEPIPDKGLFRPAIEPLAVPNVILPWAERLKPEPRRISPVPFMAKVPVLIKLAVPAVVSIVEPEFTTTSGDVTTRLDEVIIPEVRVKEVGEVILTLVQSIESETMSLLPEAMARLREEFVPPAMVLPTPNVILPVCVTNAVLLASPTIEREVRAFV